ncbi:MAG: Ig-like domain-containing protein [Patescibacteria group bacterium]|nr:Ig-like domain-containing protein [Patescibacteria group bacterium]
MSNWREQFFEWLDVPRNRSRLIIFVVGLFVLFGAVFFSTQISNLFSLFGSRAGILPVDLDKTWEQVENTGGEKRAHAKLVQLEQGGQTWLYVIGGGDARYNYINGQTEWVASNSVQRIEVDNQTGLIQTKPGTNNFVDWKQVPDLNFGHMEFGVERVGNFLYVVAGDMHTPPEEPDKIGLFYSTIERLDLTNIESGWKVYALLTGVNYYPEVISVGTDLHIMGGVYGYPFDLPVGVDGDPLQSIVDWGSSQWQELNLSTKRVIGPGGSIGSQLYLPGGTVGSTINQGTTVSYHTSTSAVVSTTSTTTTDEYDSMTTDQLQQLATDRGLNVGINTTRQTLIDTLRAADVAAAEAGLNKSLSTTMVNLAMRLKNFVTKAFAQSNLGIITPRDFDPSKPVGQKLEELQIGDYYDITWEPQATQFAALFIRILDEDSGEFSFDDPPPEDDNYWSEWQTISARTENDGKYAWRVGSYSGGTYVGHGNDILADIKLCDQSAYRLNPETGKFEIDPECTGAHVDTVTVLLKPEYWIQAAQNLTDRSEYTSQRITWDSHGANSTVKVEYKRRAVGNTTWTDWQFVTEVPAGRGGYTWQTFGTDGTTYEVQFRLTLVPPYPWLVNYYPQETRSLSNTFQVSDRGQPWVLFSAPVPFNTETGEQEPAVIEPGSNYAIRWYTNVPTQESFAVQLEYAVKKLDDNPVWYKVGTNNIVNVTAQQLAWAVPSDVYSEHATIRMVSLHPSHMGDVLAMTDEFKIKSSIDLAPLLRDALLSGDFVTTVGEHYIVKTASATASGSIERELESDYIGQLSDVWAVNRVMHLGHLRFMAQANQVTTTPQWYVTGGGSPTYIESPDAVTETVYSIVPVPQGRYGHEVIKTQAGEILVLGGASWFKSLEVSHIGKLAKTYFTHFPPWPSDPQPISPDVQTARVDNYRVKTFWVIDDVIHPFYTTSKLPDGSNKPFGMPVMDFGKSLNYKFVGNVAYRLAANNTYWSGTTPVTGLANSRSKLDAKYAFKESGVAHGRAFFGLASYTPSGDDFIAVGGLRNIANDVEVMEVYAYRIPTTGGPLYDTDVIRIEVEASASTEKWTNGWQVDADYRDIHDGEHEPIPVYNNFATGLDGGVLVHGGQSDFQQKNTYNRYDSTIPADSEIFLLDPHVPMYPNIAEATGETFGEGASGGDPGEEIEWIRFQFHPETTMYVPVGDAFSQSWQIMAEMPVNLTSSFPTAGLTAVNLTENPSRVVYQYGGIGSSVTQYMGPFSAGVPDAGGIRIEPDEGEQGQTIYDVQIAGTDSHFGLETTVFFDEPSQLALYSSGDDQVVADGQSTKTVSAKFVDDEGNAIAGQPITFEIVTGAGHFSPPDILTYPTNSSGIATITYRAPVAEDAGMVEIVGATTYAGVDYDAHVWLRAIEPVSPYSLSIISVDPKELDENTTRSIIKVRVYETGQDGNPINITDTYGGSVQFIATNGGTIDTTPTSCTYGDGEACREVWYESNNPGYDFIIAHAQVDGYFVSDRREIYNHLAGGISTIEVENLEINQNSQVLTFDIKIGSLAPVGIWRVTTLSPAVTDTGFAYTERLTTFFTVLPGENTGPYLASVVPRTSDRGDTLNITITGTNTNFDTVAPKDRTTVHFRPSPNNKNPGTDGFDITDPAKINVLSANQLVVETSIPASAKIGYWDIYVETFVDKSYTEHAEYPGHYDFTIVSSSGYAIDMTASPNALLRNGLEKSTITGILARFDVGTGGIIPVADAVVDIHFQDEREQGTLSTKEVTTDEHGGFTFTYTIDNEEAGVEPIEASILATYENATEGVFVEGSTTIIKQDNVYEFELISEVDKLEIIPGQYAASLLTATLTDPTGKVVPQQDVTFIITDGTGSLDPVIDKSNGLGIAYSHYVADANVGTVEIRAKALLPTYGWLYSNPITINKYNADTERYQLTWAANKTTVEVGGSDYVILTATLVDGQTLKPMGGWPIVFKLAGQHTADYLTRYNGVTSLAGTLTTNFVPGSQIGNVFASAVPLLLPQKSLLLQKVAGQDVGYRHIAAAPYRVPANGSAYSTVTVTVRNDNGIPLDGISVTIGTTNSTQDVLRDVTGAGINNPSTFTTSNGGHVVFRVSSNTAHKTEATALIAGTTVKAPISFENGLVPITNLGIKVPVEARDYDYDNVTNPGIWLTIHEANSVEPYEVDEAYSRDGNELLQGLPNPFYLRANKTYDVWVKGKNHLAATKQFTTSSASSTVNVTFNELKASDLSPEINAQQVTTPWHDNQINGLDLDIILAAWDADSYLADMHRDFLVNGYDLWYWLTNFGDGSPKP